jgi:hypothetical protein
VFLDENLIDDLNDNQNTEPNLIRFFQHLSLVLYLNLRVNEVLDYNRKLFLHLNREKMYQIDNQD